MSQMRAVLDSHPGDQATLQACTMYFKESGECECSETFWLQFSFQDTLGKKPVSLSFSLAPPLTPPLPLPSLFPHLAMPPTPPLSDHKIAEMYADAAIHYPKNQEILTHLFMGYVRIGDYKKQQHTAIQLHKAFPESGPYYCWRVMSILMQVVEGRRI